MMETSNLAMAVLEPHTPSLAYRLSGEQGEDWCNIYNTGTKELIDKYPDRFFGLASVPLQDPKRAAKVLEHAIGDLHFRGGYIGTNVNGVYYAGKDFDPFWAKAQELDVLVVVHPEDVAGADKMNPYGLKLVCGNPADSALCFGYMTYSGVFDRFPNLKVCILHGGGFFPYQLGRLENAT
jgi:aminocarboxymuconate-semialdehyde decarboxylase